MRRLMRLSMVELLCRVTLAVGLLGGLWVGCSAEPGRQYAPNELDITVTLDGRVLGADSVKVWRDSIRLEVPVVVFEQGAVYLDTIVVQGRNPPAGLEIVRSGT